MTDSDHEGVRVVSEGGVTVEKSFAAEEFPVPAVKFVIRSTVTEPVTVRLADEVPESFSMEGIGFHPEYGSDDWNAYSDHRVEYERTLSPGEEVLTVYGVRIEDHDGTPADFLDDPSLECVGEGSPAVETADDILGRETTSAVRDALAAGGPLSGVGDEEAPAGTDPAPRTLSGDATPAVTSPGEDGSSDPAGEVESETDPQPEPLDLEDPTESEPDETEVDARPGSLDLDDPTEPEADRPEEADGTDAESGPLDLEDPTDADGTGADGTETVDDADAESEPLGLDDSTDPETDEADADDAAVRPEAFDIGEQADSDPDEAGDAPDAGVDAAVADESVASALAAEIRAGDVDDEDLELLRSELEFEPVMPKSAEVRISRLQSRTEDLAAYSDALAAFLDEEGSGEELIESFREDVAAVESGLADLESSVSALDDGHESLAAEVDHVDAAVDDASDRLDDHDDRLASLDDRVVDAEAAAETVREDLSADVETVREEVASLQEDVSALRREVEELRSFRDRLGDAFGQ